MRFTLVCTRAVRLPTTRVATASTAITDCIFTPTALSGARLPGKMRSRAMKATPLVATDMNPAMGWGEAS